MLAIGGPPDLLRDGVLVAVRGVDRDEVGAWPVAFDGLPARRFALLAFGPSV